ncbi:hypothetical protein BJY01DRAFT_252802 [Aspergillus pseudoustus]|uniref:2EXR domain-containing protein n=1 Tax=Aspergillus pseudoustus TaxID=1810923 RepID=A0ABR4J483_9EURO
MQLPTKGQTQGQNEREQHNTKILALEPDEIACQVYEEEEHSLFKVADHEEQPFRLLDLPREIRQQIYRFTLGYRIVHVRYTHEVYRLDLPASRKGKLGWKYFVCVCDNIAPQPGSELALGRVWAGDHGVDLPGVYKQNLWRHGMPWCRFDDTKHEGGIEPGLSAPGGVGPALLHVSKEVCKEASEIMYQDNIFCFKTATAFDSFLSVNQGLSRAQLALVRNIIIYIPQPRGSAMYEWNRWLAQVPQSLHALTGLQKLRIVFGSLNEKEALRPNRPHWTWRNLSIDVRLRRTLNLHQFKDGLEFAKTLELMILGPWEEVAEQMLEAHYVYKGSWVYAP